MNFLLILFLLALGILARSKIIAIASFILLILRILKIKGLFNFLSHQGINLGLLFLVMTVLTPLVTEEVTPKDIKSTITSASGLMAILGGIIATKLNGMGIDLLKIEPQLIIGMIVGSIIGIVFWGGVPVGPLMAGGITALFIKVLRLL